MRCCFCQRTTISYWPCSEHNIKQCYHCMSDYGLNNVIFFVTERISYVHIWAKLSDNKYLIVQSFAENWTAVYLKNCPTQPKILQTEGVLFSPSNVKAKLSLLLPFL